MTTLDFPREFVKWHAVTLRDFPGEFAQRVGGAGKGGGVGSGAARAQNIQIFTFQTITCHLRRRFREGAPLCGSDRCSHTEEGLCYTAEVGGLTWNYSVKGCGCRGQPPAEVPDPRRLLDLVWRRKWQPTPVFLPGESQGPRGASRGLLPLSQPHTSFSKHTAHD